ncbi:MAG TPA: hypothetical protein DEP64_04460, partial [Ruminococcaceae bacterium]|nr:hypothetical protein [Oscillospiraceae bacterium]
MRAAGAGAGVTLAAVVLVAVAVEATFKTALTDMTILLSNVVIAVFEDSLFAIPYNTMSFRRLRRQENGLA